MKGLSIHKQTPNQATAGQDQCYAAQLALLCVLSTFLAERAQLMAAGKHFQAREVEKSFFEMAAAIWPREPLDLYFSTEFMAHDLGFKIALEQNIQVGNA